jgi:spermidine synthase
MVWVASTFFYTLIMLFGYLLLDQGFKYFSLKNLNIMILLLLGLSVLFMPLELIHFSENQNPQVAIFVTLLQNLGLPFLLLSLTSSWCYENVSQLSQNKINPHTILFYSNVGSLSGLILGPLVLFNFVPMTSLFKIVTILFFLFLILFCFLISRSFGLKKNIVENLRSSFQIKQFIQWLFPSFVMVLLMLAITNMTTIGIGSSPLIWFIPLGIFLLTFIFNFAQKPIYSQVVQSRLILLWVTLHFLSAFFNDDQIVAKISYINFYFFYFLVSNALARELYLRKPALNESGTTYNLALNLGGMLASLFVLFIIPSIPINIGNMNLELFMGTALFALFLIDRDWQRFRSLWHKTAPLKKTFVSFFIVLFISLISIYLKETSKNDIFFKRNFYGINRVLDFGHFRTYINGRTVHGGQFKTSPLDQSPLFYYQPLSAAGEYFSHSTSNSKVYAVGLGVGSLAAYSKSNEEWTFVDIDSDVLDIAKNYFSFVKNAKGRIHLEVGDGRKVLENKNEQYDLIILDAFSNDSIPTHLLTSQAFDLYDKHLTPSGKILIHESGNTMKLESIIQPQLVKRGHNWASKKVALRTNLGATSSSWILAFRKSDLDAFEFVQKKQWTENKSFIKNLGWDDDHINVLGPIWAGINQN